MHNALIWRKLWEQAEKTSNLDLTFVLNVPVKCPGNGCENGNCSTLVGSRPRKSFFRRKDFVVATGSAGKAPKSTNHDRGWVDDLLDNVTHSQVVVIQLKF